MKHALVALLLAAAALADDPALAVRVEFPVESLSEGERAAVTFHLKNQGTARLILLAIEPEDALETLGGQISRPVEALRIHTDDEKETLEVEFGAGQAGVPRRFPDLVFPALLRPGEERHEDVTFKAPAGHVFAIHFRVTYVTLDRALAEHRLFVPENKPETTGPDPTTYRRGESAETLSEEAFDNGGADRFERVGDELLLRVDALDSPEVVHAAIAVEVKPRAFSFAQAAREIGAIPDAATYFEHRGLWALAANGRTYFVGEGTRIELEGQYVPFLSEVGLRGEEVTTLHAANEDALSAYLKGEGAEAGSARDGSTVFRVKVRALPEVLKKAEELGFTIVPGGWKRRE